MSSNQKSLTVLPQLYIEKLLNHFKSQSALANTLTAATASLALFGFWLVRDYRAWVSFGTGGTPPNPSGYWRMTKIRINQLFSTDSMRDHTKLSSDGKRYLSITLPDRTGKRPTIQGRTMPQRQIPNAAKLDRNAHERLHSIPRRVVADRPELLKLDLSATEGRSTDAIYTTAEPVPKDRVLKSEIAHVHPAEDSLHVWLSEADAREVVVKGWGERFPLSAMGMCHPGWTFVYAPRSLKDVEIVEDIVKAGVRFVTGEEL